MKLKLRKNQGGQATVESILIMTIFLAVGLTISQTFTTNDIFASVIEGPWDFVDGMIRDGVWMKSNVSRSYNPNARQRHASRQATIHLPNPGFDQKESGLVK